jgi:hypothetical protein
MRRIWPGRCEIINIIEERKAQPSETGSNYEDPGSSRIVISQQTRPVHRPIQSNPIQSVAVQDAFSSRRSGREGSNRPKLAAKRMGEVLRRMGKPKRQCGVFDGVVRGVMYEEVRDVRCYGLAV